MLIRKNDKRVKEGWYEGSGKFAHVIWFVFKDYAGYWSKVDVQVPGSTRTMSTACRLDLADWAELETNAIALAIFGD